MQAGCNESHEVISSEWRFQSTVEAGAFCITSRCKGGDAVKIDPNAPAYPQPVDLPVAGSESLQWCSQYNGFPAPGLPIRLELAARAMHGMLASEISESAFQQLAQVVVATTKQEAIAKASLLHADALIAAYNASEGA